MDLFWNFWPELALEAIKESDPFGENGLGTIDAWSFCWNNSDKILAVITPTVILIAFIINLNGIFYISCWIVGQVPYTAPAAWFCSNWSQKRAWTKYTKYCIITNLPIKRSYSLLTDTLETNFYYKKKCIMALMSLVVRNCHNVTLLHTVWYKCSVLAE